MATVNDLINQLESQDYDYYLEMMLDSVPEDIDTRERSVIYDALAPAATVLAEQALNSGWPVPGLPSRRAWHSQNQGYQSSGQSDCYG